MEWHYALDGKQAGPVSEAQLQELLRTTVITEDTLVCRTGLSDWQPLRAVRGMALPPMLPGGAASRCVECQRPFPQSEMIFLNQSWVCAQCKPLFLQRLKEGVAPAGGDGIWRQGRQVVARTGTAFPMRCLKCNAPAHGAPIKRQLYWHPPAYYFLILVGILIYAIVALIIRKKAVVHIGVCALHRRQRWLTIAGCWLGVLAGIFLLIYGIDQGSWLILAGIFLIIGAAVAGALFATLVSAARIDAEFVWLRGAGRDFLCSLPEWNGPR